MLLVGSMLNVLNVLSVLNGVSNFTFLLRAPSGQVGHRHELVHKSWSNEKFE
jgi:hypothetical protein